jgi:hypothetical protein
MPAPSVVRAGQKNVPTTGDVSEGRAAEIIGEEHGVSKNTVLRAADFAHDVDAVGEVSPEAKAAIFSGDVKGSSAQQTARASRNERPGRASSSANRTATFAIMS